MTQKVQVVVMLDTNIYCGKVDRDYRNIRKSINRKGWEEDVREGVDALLELERESGPDIHFAVEQWDTAQLYHEKSNFMLPELADGFIAEGNKKNSIGRDILDQHYREGHYHVLPPVHGEEVYYDAVASFVQQVMPLTKDERKSLARWDSMDVMQKARIVQPLFRTYMNPLDKKYRSGPYEEAFKAYHKIRFNAGEDTVENFLKAFRPNAETRTAFMFVTEDKEAQVRVREARYGQDDKGKLMVLAVRPEQFVAMARRLKREIGKDVAQTWVGALQGQQAHKTQAERLR